MLPQKKDPRGRAAFTLIEVMLAATVLLFAIMGMIQVVVSGTEMLDFSRKQTIAAQIIHAEIDAIHQKDWTTMNSLAGGTRTVVLDTLSSSNVDSNSHSFGYPELMTFKNVAKNFSVTRTVAYVSGRTDMVTVTLTVSWTGNTGHAYSRQGTTYFGKNGLNVTFQRS